jgi:hypothetical protein
MKSWISYASAGSTRPGQRFRNSSSVIKRDASNVGCGFVRSRPPGPATDRNCKSFQRQRRRLAVQRLCARILKTWGAKREDAWRLRWRTGSASVRSWLFLASQPLRPCQLHHFNFARRQRNAEFLNFRLTSQALRKCTTGCSSARGYFASCIGSSCGAYEVQFI